MAASIIQQKRFTNEKALLAKEPLHYTTAYPDKENPLIWHCLIIGQKDTPYYGGQYIYKVHHSPKYPAEPPDYYFLTPSGRYEIDKKICLTNSSYHKGEWSSTWNIKTILISFYSIFLDEKEHGISHRHDPPEQCKKYATESIAYNKKHHEDIYSKFDFSHLADDAPNIKPAISIPAIPEPAISIPAIPEPVIPVAVIPVPVIPIPVIPEPLEQKPVKKVRKNAKKNIQIIDDNKANELNYNKISDNIKDIEYKLQKQFENIKHLEEDINSFK
jgi:ubiquitin-protein ligase